MTEFEFTARNGAKIKAHYMIAGGRLNVIYRDHTVSVAEGLNEIANAFLRDNLMRSILGEIGDGDQQFQSKKLA
jgi:hypothetical protein